MYGLMGMVALVVLVVLALAAAFGLTFVTVVVGRYALKDGRPCFRAAAALALVAMVLGGVAAYRDVTGPPSCGVVARGVSGVVTGGPGTPAQVGSCFLTAGQHCQERAVTFRFDGIDDHLYDRLRIRSQGSGCTVTVEESHGSLFGQKATTRCQSIGASAGAYFVLDGCNGPGVRWSMYGTPIRFLTQASPSPKPGPSP